MFCAAGVKVHDVFSPHPVHAPDDALGTKRSRLPIAAFFFGIYRAGLSALWMQTHAGFRLVDYCAAAYFIARFI
jgi:hypothetical protein